MSLYHSLVTLTLVSFTAGAVFNRRGSANETAPYSNTTFTTALSISAQTPLTTSVVTSSATSLQNFYSNATGTSSEYETSQPTNVVASRPQALSIPPNATSSSLDGLLSVTPELAPTPINGTTKPTRSSNATCTINIPNASLDYWFAPTYSYAIGTMTTAALNFTNPQSYTLVPQTASFDVTSAVVSDFACTFTESYYSEFDFTLTMCVQYTGTPSAATTSVIYRSEGYSPFPSEGIIPISDALSYDLYRPDSFPSATAVVTLAPNVTQAETSATPFVYFTAYEIETGNETRRVQLQSAQAYPYRLDDADDKNTAIGPVPEEFLEQIPHSDCEAGQLQATVTVLIVVNLYYRNRPNLDPFFIHFESSVDGFEEPPVVMNGFGPETSNKIPLTVADWNLPSTSMQPTPASVRASNLPGLLPTARVLGAASVTVGSVGASPIVIGPSSEVVIGSQTLQPGGPAVNVGDGTPVSLAPSATAIVLGGQTSLLPQVFQAPVPPVLTVGSSTLVPNAATQFFVAPGQTLTPGGVATVDGTVVSLAPSASFVVIGGSTQVLSTGGVLLPTTTQTPQFVFGSSTITAQPAQVNPSAAPTFVLSDQTLLPGGAAITFSGTTLSLNPSGDVLIANGASSTLRAQTEAVSSPTTIAVGNQVFSALPRPSGPAFVVASETLFAGGPAITISGTTLSLAPSASFIVINHVTSTLTNAAVPLPTSAPLLTIGDVTFKPLPGTATEYLIGSILLTAGGSIVISGTTISLAPGATELVVNGQTSSIPRTVQPVITNPPLLTIGSITYTALSGGGTTFVIGGETLTPGGTITVDGTTINLAASATELIYGSSGRSVTTALFPATTTRHPSITSTPSPSARQSNFEGQATATSRKEGAALGRTSQLSVSLAVVAFLCSALG
ncbi:uncharacterized protein yc1106_06239 [Curvularia clavata]|uniref:Uncharacterized protein n=1 Tax=Curvularia clavata TaxID=95742 RepID=A0A9Q8ZC23_CURCL|nr:uncharacterized protein yc1106_06239 [Curvularia clavata]